MDVKMAMEIGSQNLEASQYTVVQHGLEIKVKIVSLELI
jgi:hypothetical protein